MTIKPVILIFEAGFKYGSCEHFFHFMWGYLLPAVHYITQHKNEERHYIFRSCGPLMDLRIHEVMRALKVKYTVESKNFTSESCEAHLLKRWDVCLLKPLLLARSNEYHALNTIHAQFDAQDTTPENYLAFDLIGAINVAKQAIYDGFNLSGNDNAPSIKPLLVLKRSEEPEFYRKDIGSAEISGYGTGRRALQNTTAIVDSLSELNIPAQVFEQGSFNLAGQIKAYNNAAGIIGIRGAEFANLLWLPKSSKVVLIDPLNIPNPPVQKYLAELMQLDYRQIDVNQGTHLTIDTDQLISALG